MMTILQKYIRWTLLGTFFLVLHCQDPNSENTTISKDKNQHQLQPQAQAQQLTLTDKLDSLQLLPWLNKPYKILLYYDFLDTPDHKILGLYFQEKLRDTLRHKAPDTLSLSMERSGEYTDILLHLEVMSSAFMKKLKNCDWGLAISASLADRMLQIRSLNMQTGRIESLIKQKFGYPVEVADIAMQILPHLWGFAGYIIAVAEEKVQIVFRGSGSELVNLENLQAGKYLWVFNGRNRLRDCLLQIKETNVTEGYLVASASYLGKGKPRLGFKAVQVYFPGGKQRFRLVDDSERPLAEFSVFASYQAFSTDRANYQETTGTSGEFTLHDSKRQPMFLVIAKNIEGINFSFIRRIVVVEATDDPVIIRLSNLNQALQNVEKAIPERLKIKRLQETQRFVRMRLEEANGYIKARDFKAAIVAIRLAKEHLNNAPDADKTRQLRQILDRVENNYQKALIQHQAYKSYMTATKLLEAADKHVHNLEYAEAQKKLSQAQKIWPPNLYRREYQGLILRRQRLLVLEQEQNTPLGRSRQFLIGKVLKWEPQDVTAQKLTELYNHLKTFFTKGNMEEEQKYNDLEYWLRLRIALNKLSEKMAGKAQQFLLDYQKASSVRERRRLYEEHEKYYQSSKFIDKLLTSDF